MGYICYSCVHRSDCADADFQTGICEHYKHKPAEKASGVRLIDANELKKAIEQGEGFSWDSLGKDDLCVRKKYIDNAPTVEAIPTELHEKILDKVEGELLECQSNLRPQGEWINKPVNCGTCILQGYECNCGRVVMQRENFCPECGADMRGGAT